MDPVTIILIVYFIAANLISVSAVIIDKYNAVHHNRRISEKTLIILSALSGCVLPYACMNLIRHKTRKLKFMLGIPLIFIAEVLLVVLLYKFIL